MRTVNNATRQAARRPQATRAAQASRFAFNATRQAARRRKLMVEPGCPASLRGLELLQGGAPLDIAVVAGGAKLAADMAAGR